MRSSFLKICSHRGVEVDENQTIVEAEGGKLAVEGGEIIEFDECLWCTEASAAEWLRSTGLKTGGLDLVIGGWPQR